VAVQGLGFLESGITDQLNHFSNTLLEFSSMLRHVVGVLVISYSNVTHELSVDPERHGPIIDTPSLPSHILAREPGHLKAARPETDGFRGADGRSF